MNSYVNMGVGAFLGTVFVLMSVSIASEGIFHSEAPEKEGFAIIAEEGASEAGAGGAAEAEVDIKPLLASADPSCRRDCLQEMRKLSHLGEGRAEQGRSEPLGHRRASDRLA